MEERVDKWNEGGMGGRVNGRKKGYIKRKIDR